MMMLNFKRRYETVGEEMTKMIISTNSQLGGPLMGEDTSNSLNPYSYLAGIVSFGPANCGTPNYPGVYTVNSIIISFIETISITIKYAFISFIESRSVH